MSGRDPTTRDVARLNSFVDGVMIVSMTLLVLDVRLPDDVAGLDGAPMIKALMDLWPRYVGYVLSFLVVAQYWMGYTERFGRIKSADSNFAMLNALFLVVIGFIPFTTAVLARNHGVVATVLYAINMILTSLLLVTIWTYAVRKRLLDYVTPAGEHWQEIAPWLQIAAIFSFSIFVAAFDARAAKLLWLLLALPSFKPRTAPGVSA